MLRFEGEKGLLAWLLSDFGRDIRMQCVADEESRWQKARPTKPKVKPPSRVVLLVTEGNCVTVYASDEVTIRRIDRPVCKTPAGNDKADELLERRLRWWGRLNYRKCFWMDSRSLAERYMDKLFKDLGDGEKARTG